MVLHIFGGEVPGGNATTLWDSPAKWNNAFFNRLLPALDGTSPRIDVPDRRVTRAIPAYAARCPAILNALKSTAARRI